MVALWPRGMRGARREKLTPVKSLKHAVPHAGSFVGLKHLLSAADLLHLEESPRETQGICLSHGPQARAKSPTP